MDKSFRSCCFDDPETGALGLSRMPYPWDQGSTDAHLLIENQEFLNLIYWHWVHSLNKLSALRNVEGSLAAIQAILADELSE